MDACNRAMFCFRGVPAIKSVVWQVDYGLFRCLCEPLQGNGQAFFGRLGASGFDQRIRICVVAQGLHAARHFVPLSFVYSHKTTFFGSASSPSPKPNQRLCLSCMPSQRAPWPTLIYAAADDRRCCSLLQRLSHLVWNGRVDAEGYYGEP